MAQAGNVALSVKVLFFSPGLICRTPHFPLQGKREMRSISAGDVERVLGLAGSVTLGPCSGGVVSFSIHRALLEAWALFFNESSLLAGIYFQKRGRLPKKEKNLQKQILGENRVPQEKVMEPERIKLYIFWHVKTIFLSWADVKFAYILLISQCRKG